jgi:hypothetical protein
LLGRAEGDDREIIADVLDEQQALVPG